jgi:hypothetical protein
MRDNRQGLTDEQFAELARRRDARIEEVIGAVCTQQGWDRANVGVHVGGSHSAHVIAPAPMAPASTIGLAPARTSSTTATSPAASKPPAPAAAWAPWVTT